MSFIGPRGVRPPGPPVRGYNAGARIEVGTEAEG